LPALAAGVTETVLWPATDLVASVLLIALGERGRQFGMDRCFAV